MPDRLARHVRAMRWVPADDRDREPGSVRPQAGAPIRRPLRQFGQRRRRSGAARAMAACASVARRRAGGALPRPTARGPPRAAAPHRPVAAAPCRRPHGSGTARSARRDRRRRNGPGSTRSPRRTGRPARRRPAAPPRRRAGPRRAAGRRRPGSRSGPAGAGPVVPRGMQRGGPPDGPVARGGVGDRTAVGTMKRLACAVESSPGASGRKAGDRTPGVQRSQICRPWPPSVTRRSPTRR